jgi:hypothetical protein
MFSKKPPSGIILIDSRYTVDVVILYLMLLPLLSLLLLLLLQLLPLLLLLPPPPALLLLQPQPTLFQLIVNLSPTLRIKCCNSQPNKIITLFRGP